MDFRYQSGPTHRHNVIACRVCGMLNDHATGITGKDKPEDGNVSLCFTCGEVSIFVVGPLGLALREPTDDELAAIYREHREALDFMTQVRARRRMHEH